MNNPLGLLGAVTCQARLEGKQWFTLISHLFCSGTDLLRSLPRGEKSMCKGPEATACSECWRNSCTRHGKGGSGAGGGGAAHVQLVCGCFCSSLPELSR